MANDKIDPKLWKQAQQIVQSGSCGDTEAEYRNLLKLQQQEARKKEHRPTR